MSAYFYNWKRFWSPRTSQINLADGGYLPDPDGEWTRFYNPDLVAFESIAEVPCLGLLGEPGIGKSSALRALRAAVEAKIKQQGGEAIWIDLHEYGSEDRLVRDLFESTTYTAWATGNHYLHVFLDSLDECLMRVSTVATVLVSKLRECPRERLHLRIACRTADWPNSLESALTGYWGEQAVKVYELAPLRRVDAIEAARANRLSTDAFIEATDRAGAVPLAIKPITLQFLLNTFSRSSKLPSKQTDLYFEGCQLLCEEANEERRDAGLSGTLSVKQRLAIAGRIAAVTVFANRAALWLDVDRGDIPDDDLRVAGLSGGTVDVEGDRYAVTEAAVRETLGTGLFSSRGPNRIGWAHRTYAEFLAALHVVHQKMTLPQIASLLNHPDDPGRKLVPQLHGVAAWLASMEPKFFQETLKTDPDMLLLSDVHLTDEASRVALVESFLRMLDERRIQHPGFVAHRLYRKLAHPGLAAQLRPLIHNPARSLVSRLAAIDIAAACEVKALQDDLARTALDQAHALQLRIRAAYAVAGFGDPAVRSRMMPLAAGQAGADPEDELKGCGLRAVWPDHITASELFALLTPPKRANLYGAYRAFLRKGLVEHLKPQDLPLALMWVRDQVPNGVSTDRFEGLADQIMLRAWERFGSAEVSQPFAEVAVLTLGRKYGITGEGVEHAIGKEESKRRSLVRAILPLYTDTSEAVVSLYFGSAPIVHSGDVIWMIEELRASQSEKTKSLWARLILHLFDGGDAQQVNAIITASEQEPAIETEFSALLRPVTLDSPEAQKMREDYLDAKKLEQNRRQAPPAVVPPPQERIATLLDRFESGDASAWWQLNLEMTLEPDSSFYGNDLELDVTELPGWKAASEITRTRIVTAAKRYLMVADPETQTWLGTNVWHRPAVAGYRALRLLFAEDPPFVESIPADIWKKWAQTVLAHFPPYDSQVNALDVELLKRSYSYSPDSLIEALVKLIDKENKESEYIFITRTVRCCWDERLAAALSAKARDPQLKPVAMGCLLEDLLDRHVADARAFAESLVQAPPPPEDDARLRAVVAATTLLAHAQDAGWGILYRVFQSDTKFGREVFSRVASDISGTIAARLTEDQSADLYVWLVRQYPPDEDPQIEGAHGVGPREMLGHLRDGVLAYLKSRGTSKGCEAIQRIARELPGLDWLSWTLAEARVITRQRTWVPPKPEDIIELAGDSETRLVQSGDQLLEVLIESLHRLQEKLLGETPRSRFLWNQCPSGKWRPREEESLSDYLKGHLDDDIREKGIVLGREVQIRRRAGEKQGEDTDILVTAVRMNSSGEIYDSVSAIIEVKGCWHRRISGAMKSQLVDRYLKDNQCRHGLYIVGWFGQESWDKRDARRKQVPRCCADEASKRLELQASKLSKDDLLIRSYLLDVSLR